MAFGDDAGGFGGFGGDYGSPWDFGTNFGTPNSFGVGQYQPTMPQVDLAQNFAASLAQNGIRPGQFMANPAVAAPVLAPTPAPTLNNSWDATPVSTPGGAAVSLPGQPKPPSVAGGPPAPVTTGGSEPDAGTEPAAPTAEGASAAASPADKAGAEKTMAQRITEGLKGVRAPTPPALQSIRSPALPQHGALKQGQLLALLTALQGGQGGAGPGLKLPPTLGASLKGLY